MKRAILALAISLGLLAPPALADSSPFDLAGPALRISVTRQGVTLPIAQVLRLAVGDKLQIAADLPPSETAHYLLVAAMLREPTNPPPDGWFWKSASWKQSARGGGAIALTVPAGAHHLVLFLAPATGGDFVTLRNAVKARPGAFVRAAQDLEQASLDHSRYDAYIAAIRQLAAKTPERLAQVSPVVASSLRIKINENCLQRQTELQAACLLDARQSLVLGNDDKAATSSLTAAAGDLALSLSATPAGGFGYYSSYISTIRDVFGIFGAMHTAKYQYIPALGVPAGETLGLVLNTPPSFANPKSVLVAALPEIGPADPPALTVSPNAPAPCLGASEPVLPIALGPLFYATAYAHQLALHVALPGGASLDLPVVADVTRGGLAVGAAASTKSPPPEALTGPVAATLRGMWGFEPFTGPAIKLETPGDWHWHAAPGKDDGPLLLTGGVAACVAEVTVATADGTVRTASWKATNAGEIAVTMPALAGRTGSVVLVVAGPPGTLPARLTVASAPKPMPPAALVLAHNSEPAHGDRASAIRVVLASPDEIPADARLNFSLKASGKDRFTERESVEIGTADGSETVRLTQGSALTRIDPGLMIATLVPGEALSRSAFGPLRARLVLGGVAGDWLSLGTLVRLPRLKHLACPGDPAAACTLTGDELYLLASVSATADFDHATSVPEGYPGFSLTVPHPARGGVLFVRLHDAPEVVNGLRITDFVSGARKPASD